MMKNNLKLFIGLFCLFVFAGLSGAVAQEGENQNLSEVVIEEPVITIDERIELNSPDVVLDQILSLFLTGNEENLIIAARAGVVTRPPTETEFSQEQKTTTVSRPSSVREISLGGILYTSSNDWTIWINSQKITPKNIPPAIMDIDVSKDRVRLKWIDFQTNQIFPVKLKTHQRFNFDSRMFLPG